MSTVELPRPLRVSPLIKFGRWSFLIMGIAYGAMNQSRLAKREVGIREIEAKQKVIRDAKLAIEKKIQDAADMKMIDDWSVKSN